MLRRRWQPQGRERTALSKNHTALPWNQQGVPGTNGTAGTNGTPGVSGWEIVRVERVAHPSTDLIWTVNCSAGKKVVGGGVTKQIIGDSHVIESGPTDDGLGWFSGIDNTDDFPEPDLLRDLRVGLTESLMRGASPSGGAPR